MLFEYEPLDHLSPSIRLLYLLPYLSIEGFISCFICHSSIKTSYDCLSYVWDPFSRQEPNGQNQYHGEPILLNDRRVRIRQNLFDFLCTARNNARRGHSLGRIKLCTPIWIDALCIDQTNRKERIHQVTQMGDIYSSALTVHAWLGKAPLLSEEPDRRLTKEKTTTETKQHEWFDQTEDVLEKWVAEASWQRERGRLIWHTDRPSTLDRHFRSYRRHQFRKPPHANLVSMLDRFANEQCAEVRDRIFSLLSLLPPQTPRIRVDYAVGLDRLAYDVLQQNTESVCVCVALVVTRSLGLAVGED